MLLTQRLQRAHSVAKGDVLIPSQLIEDVLAPDLALRLGHHICFLLQERAALMRRENQVRNRRVRRKRALGA